VTPGLKIYNNIIKTKEVIWQLILKILLIL